MADNEFGGSDALREALRIAMAPNRLATGQVATQDFAPSPTPPNEHGFLFSRIDGGLKFNPYEAVKNFMAYRAPPGALSTSGDDAPVRNAMDAAGWVGMSGLGLNAFGAVPANALGSAGAKAPRALTEALMKDPPRVENPIKAYHGSPHDFRQFSLDKIGTGEGAQAYGHGLYFAENEAVARSYRDALSKDQRFVAGKGSVPPEAIDYLNYFQDHRGPANAKEQIENIIRWAEGQSARGEQRWRGDKFDGVDVMDIANTLRRVNPDDIAANGAGKMYEVAIHATPDQFLDWDKPLSQQSEAVRAAISDPAKLGLKPQTVTTSNGTVYSGWVDEAGKVVGQFAKGDTPPARIIPDHPNISVENLVKTYLPGQNTKHLAEAGIPGIRYLDQGSRGAGQGTSNYVVFDPNLIEILRKYGLLGPVAAGATANALMGDQGQQ